MGLPLYVTCLFPFAAFGILSLLWVLNVLIMMCLGGFSFFFVLMVLCSVNFQHLGESLFPEVRKDFCYYLIKLFVDAFSLYFLSFFYIHDS
jgi:hypothetical protein